ncbi:hypothetical protein [Candidatus Uabimicrobium amorphum]|uniref:Uncharacterized protein n=1 Tax=Uabimicrobium amorphum TaxID=2596890 RepID=A0A5S9F4F8_UABAM|nr:hypothetical protein [Candidatus Uabimicrobium amorphum]BBM84549.1 hypothetical protein UABAM_02910 [Candidatus Uabimicrobium amorphum]
MKTYFKLHASLLKYCKERYAVLQQNKDSTKNSIQSNFLGLMMEEIKNLECDYDRFSDAIEVIKLAAEMINLEQNSEDIVAQERDRFVKTLLSYSSDTLDTLSQDFCQRLSKNESQIIRKKAQEAWRAGFGYYFPLEPHPNPKFNLKAFFSTDFEKKFSNESLHAMMKSWNVECVYELNEGGDDYIVATDNWEPLDSSPETFWFCDECDWILYVSHENSTTVGGKLAEWVLSQWKDAENHIWRIPEFG